MEKFVKISTRVVFSLSILILPFMLIAGLYGLAGSDKYYFIIIWGGYIGTIVSSYICISKQRFFPLVIVFVSIFISGILLDRSFWETENAGLCQELRANPACVENACGFTCSNFKGIKFVTGASVCSDKDLGLCKPDLGSGITR